MATLGSIPSNSTLTSADVSDFTEAVQDTLNTTLVAGTGISLVYNDAANSLTINSTGGGGGGSIAVADTNSVDMTWDGTTLSAVIPTTATPQLARMGVGVAADATILARIGAGDLQEVSSGLDGAGAYLDIRHGTSGSPNTTQSSTLKVSRYEQFTSVTQGADMAKYAAIQGINIATASSKAQPVGIYGYARSSSTFAGNGSTQNPDACGASGWGTIASGGVGIAIGGYFQGKNNSATGSGVTAIEGQTNNSTGISTGLYNSSIKSYITGLWLPLVTQSGGGAIEIGNPAGYKWTTGLSFKSQNGGAIDTTSAGRAIEDNSSAGYSYLINGTHASAAIAIASTSGSLMAGLTTAGTAPPGKAIIKSSVDTDAALIVQTNSPTHTGWILGAVNSAGTELLSVGATGTLRINGTGGAGNIFYNEQSANPAAATQDTAMRTYMKGDKFVWQFNNGGTTRYFTLDLTQSGATATIAQSTTAP